MTERQHRSNPSLTPDPQGGPPNPVPLRIPVRLPRQPLRTSGWPTEDRTQLHYTPRSRSKHQRDGDQRETRRAGGGSGESKAGSTPNCRRSRAGGHCAPFSCPGPASPWVSGREPTGLTAAFTSLSPRRMAAPMRGWRPQKKDRKGGALQPPSSVPPSAQAGKPPKPAPASEIIPQKRKQGARKC